MRASAHLSPAASRYHFLSALFFAPQPPDYPPTLSVVVLQFFFVNFMCLRITTSTEPANSLAGSREAARFLYGERERERDF